MLDPAAAATAVLLGAIAAFNPCGFALLPAYLTVIVTGSADGAVTRLTALRRAVGFALAMTVGFLTVFTGFGLLFGAINLGLQGSVLPYVSYATVVIGALVAALGVTVLVRGELRGPGLRTRGRAPRADALSQVGYGAAFAVASLSCTIGLFLGVVSQALSATGPVAAVTPFVLYGAGMGAAVLAVSLVAALAGSAVAARMRRHTRSVMHVGGGLMIVAGLYVCLFGLAEILPRYGVDALNGVLHATARGQAAVSSWVASWGTVTLWAFVAVMAGAAIAVVVAARRADRTAAAVAAVGPQHGGVGVRVADPTTLDAVRKAARSQRDERGDTPRR